VGEVVRRLAGRGDGERQRPRLNMSETARHRLQNLIHGSAPHQLAAASRRSSSRAWTWFRTPDHPIHAPGHLSQLAERLRPFLADLLQLLEKHHQLLPTPPTRALLLAASTSTISRNLVQLREQQRWPRRSLRPPSRLRREVPVRVRNWQLEDRPGYLEIDLVSHSGPWLVGEWIYTLSATDLETGWSELVPIMTKSQREVLAGFARLHRQLPFPLLGLPVAVERLVPQRKS
jgi:hypothetical protein